MPHRVASFFRNSSENISNISSIKSNIRAKKTVERQQSYASSISDEGSENGSIKMPDSAEPKKHHRLPLSFGRTSKEVPENPHASLSWKIESPPIVFYGDAENSTGALVSGLMFLEVKDEMLDIESFDATLNIHVHQKRPFANHCADCAHQYTELKKWTFLSQPATLPKGRHQYPFSILMGGHLPACMDTPITSISYDFKAVVKSKATPAPIKFEQQFDVKRALPIPELPHHSVRVFPPTNIKAGAHYMQVIHPTGSNTVQFKIDGLVSLNSSTNSIEYWKLKKVTWKLEETTKTVVPACAKHGPAGADGTQPKGMQRVDTRILGEKAMHEGWKSDYGPREGSVELEFDYSLLVPAVGSKHHGLEKNHGARYACDSKSRDGTEVTHALMLEMVVSREWAPVGKPHLATQTGTGRILRMHYHVLLTEPLGMGVSWDNESPPVYQDVPPSPPSYPDEDGLVQYDDLMLLDGRGSTEPDEQETDQLRVQLGASEEQA